MNFRHVEPEGEEQLPKRPEDLHRRQKRENATNGMITDHALEELVVLSHMRRKPEESARLAAKLALRGAKAKAKAAARRVVNPLRPCLAANHQAAVQM
jgi:hypothetical protein